MSAGLLLLALAAGSGLPASLVGDWAEDVARCGGEDTTGVRIEPRRITFYEARGQFRTVSMRGVATEAHAVFTGEGRRWSETLRFELKPDGPLVLTALGGTHSYLRCPDRKF